MEKEKQQYQDYLTGILNRMGLFQAFEKLDGNLMVNVLFFDIDNFKTVNDVYGHKKGDEALVHFAQILNELMPSKSLVARLGGDEFIAIVPDIDSREDISLVANKVLSAVRKLRKKDKSFDVISCSIGIIRNYCVKDKLDIALSLSDRAMYFAKQKGKDAYVFYEDYEEKINFENSIEKGVAKAIEEGRIIVKYHPILNLQSSRLVGTEACCLWVRQDGSILGRNDFRPILLKNEYINELDMYFFEKVCKEYTQIKDINNSRNKICIQFSHLILMNDDRIEQLDEIMNRYGVSPEDFEINLDESIFSGRVAISKIIENMNNLKRKGFSLALSHFGEDFSSVRYLRQLPISAIKLDGDFILEAIKDEQEIKTLNGIIKLSKGFKYLVVGCKVINTKVMSTLSECGCDAATGSLFSEKLDLDEYIEYLKGAVNDDQDTISYRFKDDFASDKVTFKGKIIGDDIELVKGISANWGAVSFPGGLSQTNYLELPVGLMNEGSYTFSMWIKPRELQNWTSVIYMRYQSGFASFMPNVFGGRCMFRVKEDACWDVWNDAMASGLNVGKWNFLAVSYDSFTSIARVYINGEQNVVLGNVPNMGAPQEIWLGGDVFQNSFSGLVSGFQINYGALDSEEIKRRYDEFTSEEEYVGDEIVDEVEYTEIEVHDPAIYEDKESGDFYIYGTDAQGFTSKDLIHWKSLGTLVSTPPEEAISHTKSEAIWAPDIVKVNDEYRLYCSNSSWGVRQSCIFMATANTPKGPFTPKAVILKTVNEGNVNAIDANIVEDHETGQQYMVYGSFWGGIHMIELDKNTGLAIEGQGLGKQIASRPQWNDTAIEGPYIIYHPETKYYYLFVSYGSLTCDYNIRVGRSKSVTGPYLDYHGLSMNSTDDVDCTRGLMISCGYRYLTGQAYMGPGHNSVLLRDNGEMYLVSHIRKMAFNQDHGPGLLQIRKMIMTPDGWPIALGQPYNAEKLLEVRDALLIGEYERIELRPSIPQGIMHAHPMKLCEDGRLQMASVIGTWERVGKFELKLSYGSITEFVHFEKGLDKENNKTTVVMCGLNSQGICTWAKKEELYGASN